MIHRSWHPATAPTVCRDQMLVDAPVNILLFWIKILTIAYIKTEIDMLQSVKDWKVNNLRTNVKKLINEINAVL